MARIPVQLSPDVIHRIWSQWKDGDGDEDAILRRVLPVRQNDEIPAAPLAVQPELSVGSSNIGDISLTDRQAHQPNFTVSRGVTKDRMWTGKIRWVDDILAAIESLGGQAYLQSIYREVEKRRTEGGRSNPPSLEASVRQVIESHCPDSENYKEGNPQLFAHVARGCYKVIERG